MTKKNLLTAVATVALLATAGTASAHDLTFLTPGAAGSPIDAADTGGATTAYRLAEEAIATTSGVFALTAALSAGSQFPSGNNFIQIDLNGGTFDAALTSAAVTATGCTVVLSSGGADGGTTASFLVSSAGGVSCNTAQIVLPITPNAAADVWVRTTISTEAGSPIDPANPQTQPAGNPFGTLFANQEALRIVDRVNAFQVDIDGDIAGGALGDTFATLTQTPVYTEFFVGAAGHDGVLETDSNGQLGTIEIIVDTTAFRDLALNPVLLADVTDADVTVTGSFSAFDGAGDATLGAVTYDALAANVATYNNRQVALTAGTPLEYDVTTDGSPTTIPVSTYVASVSYTLDSDFTPEGPVGGSLETIGRDGTNIILPWMNSSSVQATNGSTNVARLGNVGGAATGPVFAQVLNSTTGIAGAPVQIFPNIPVGGERVITTAILTTNLGEFGRGDIQISVEAPANTITARRYATLANGSVTELSNGTVASEQTPADPNDVP